MRSLPACRRRSPTTWRGGRGATRPLLSLGHRRIGFVGDTMRGAAAASRVGLGFVTSQHRLNGYRQALAAAEVCHDPALVRRGPHGPANAEALTGELLELPNRPSAIFAASDTQAMGVLAAAERYGIGVPRELSVIGFDDIESAALLGLSTVRQPLVDSGAESARRLCALMRGERVIPLRQQLALEIVQRSTTASFHVTGRRARSSAGAVRTGPAVARQAFAPAGLALVRTAIEAAGGCFYRVRRPGAMVPQLEG